MKHTYLIYQMEDTVAIIGCTGDHKNIIERLNGEVIKIRVPIGEDRIVKGMCWIDSFVPLISLGLSDRNR